jgi:hypothetical protein
MKRTWLLLAGLLSVAGCGPAAVSEDPAREDTPHRWTVHRPISPPVEKSSDGQPNTAESDHPQAVQPTDASRPAAEPRVQSYNTGDSPIWPHYDFPLVINLEVPEVPPEIAKPAPKIDDP